MQDSKIKQDRTSNSIGLDGSSNNSSVVQRSRPGQLVLPDSLKRQLIDFRNYVWRTKVLEASVLALFVGLFLFLVLYICDRWIDTAVVARWGFFVVTLGAWLLLPYALYRWVWSHHRADQLARLLRRREPAIGDQLLSVIELAENQAEQNRSPALCQAAMAQVAVQARSRDFTQAAPRHWLRPLVFSLSVGALILVALATLYPPAVLNAWMRFASPWRAVDRFTFATVEPLPGSLVVPHGESVSWRVQLNDNSTWQPETAGIQLSDSTTRNASLAGRGYEFELPALLEDRQATVTVGDFYQSLELMPMHRPELTGVEAQVQLPEYLGRKQAYQVDLRSGVLSVVSGSHIQVKGTVSRELEKVDAQGNRSSRPASDLADSSQPVDQLAEDRSQGVIVERIATAVSINGSDFNTQMIPVLDGSISFSLTWLDQVGLSGRQPFTLDVKAIDDEAPSVIAQGLPRQSVVLDSEQLNFTALAADDFGIRRVGMVWRPVEGGVVADPSYGERTIASGGFEQSSLQVAATFCAKDFGIKPQAIELMLFVEDYLPGRPPVYSAPYLLYILTGEQHAIWIANQMNKWQSSALDVRDTEMQLFESNKQLRLTAQTGLESAEGASGLVESLRRQAALEEANGRKLNALTLSGAELLRQAARNPDVAVSELEQWAQMLQTLQDIGDNRMPSVADLLKQAANQATSEQNARQGKSLQAGKNRAAQNADGNAQDQQDNSSTTDTEAPSQVPSVVDVESTMQNLAESQKPTEKDATAPGQKSAARLGMAATALIGPEQKSSDESESAASQKVDQGIAEAVQQQTELLSEFEKIADQLNAVMANLEGSTLVKRLKAASREQLQVADVLAAKIQRFFGTATEVSQEDRSSLVLLADSELASSKSLSFIMDDMQAFLQRRRTDELQQVLDDMKSTDVLVSLQKLSEELQVEQGMAMAQAEYWADTLDRWAEDLLPVSDQEKEKEKEKGESESKASIPPRMILEMLQILEGEVNLREQTRVASQAQNAITIAEHTQEFRRLETIQRELRQRAEQLVDDLSQLPESGKNFENEIKLLEAVSLVMDEARAMLEFGDVGERTIAAETEAIELLLQSQRINPKSSGGGGGNSPGGGGAGSTQDSALALLGSGLNQQERREFRDVGQATGQSSGREFPEEFRAGLDAYFESLEQR